MNFQTGCQVTDHDYIYSYHSVFVELTTNQTSSNLSKVSNSFRFYLPVVIVIHIVLSFVDIECGTCKSHNLEIMIYLIKAHLIDCMYSNEIADYVSFSNKYVAVIKLT